MPADDKTDGGQGPLVWSCIFVIYFAIYLVVALEDIFHLGIF